MPLNRENLTTTMERVNFGVTTLDTLWKIGGCLFALWVVVFFSKDEPPRPQQETPVNPQAATGSLMEQTEATTLSDPVSKTLPQQTLAEGIAPASIPRVEALGVELLLAREDGLPKVVPVDTIFPNGRPLWVSIAQTGPGWLYLLTSDPHGMTERLFPVGGETARIDGGLPIVLPTQGLSFEGMSGRDELIVVHSPRRLPELEGPTTPSDTESQNIEMALDSIRADPHIAVRSLWLRHDDPLNRTEIRGRSLIAEQHGDESQIPAEDNSAQSSPRR